MTNCSCEKCNKLDKIERSNAIAKLNEGICELQFNYWEYNCGDGCCHESGTEFILNGYLVTRDCYDSETVIEVLKLLGHRPVIIDKEDL